MCLGRGHQNRDYSPLNVSQCDADKPIEHMCNDLTRRARHTTLPTGFGTTQVLLIVCMGRCHRTDVNISTMMVDASAFLESASMSLAADFALCRDSHSMYTHTRTRVRILIVSALCLLFRLVRQGTLRTALCTSMSHGVRPKLSQKM